MLCSLSVLLASLTLVVDARATPVAPRASSSPRISTLVVLGDSYSDNCNAWRLRTGSQDQYPFPACPPAPTGRADGGVQWPEYIANQTQLKVYDYASSGATCNNTLFPRFITTTSGETVANPSVADQIDQVQATLQGTYGTAPSFDPASAAVAIFIGTNDLTFFVAQYQDSRSKDVLPIPGTSTNDMAGCVLQQIVRLYDLGFRTFVPMDAIPLQATALFSQDTVAAYGGYRIQQDGALISAFVEQLVLARNGLVTAKLNTLRAQLPDATIKPFDTYNFYLPLIESPSPEFGSNGTSEEYCYVCPGVNGTAGECTTCDDPERFVFWDQLHPSERSAQLLAAAMESFIADL